MRQGTRWLGLAGVIVALLALTIAVAACDDDEEGDGGGATATTEEGTPAEGTPSEGASVDIELSEFVITADPASVAAGSVTFNVANVGGEAHEFMVIESDLAPDALPVVDDGSVDEDQVTVLGEIEEDELPAQTGEGELNLDMEAGSYVLICNLVEEEESGEMESHYQEGMHTAFEVTE
jgi:hypothetical protein